MRNTASRSRWSLIALGCAVLGWSLFSWALSPRDNEYAWVDFNSSSAPATETAQIWRTSASCLRPYLVKASLRSKAKLRAFYEFAPQEVRAARNREYHLASGEQDYKLQNIPQREYDATLHAQHAEWYATVARLAIEENQWEQRLINVVDQTVMIGKSTRQTFRAYSGLKVAGVSAQGDLDHYVLFLLGLGGLPGDEELAIELNCVSMTPAKRVVITAPLLTQIWRWPIDHIVAFTLGSELVFLGVLYLPIARWVTHRRMNLGVCEWASLDRIGTKRFVAPSDRPRTKSATRPPA